MVRVRLKYRRHDDAGRDITCERSEAIRLIRLGLAEPMGPEAAVKAAGRETATRERPLPERE